jgi:putative transposase
MRFDPARHHRRSIRLRNHDYRGPGAYFITVVTFNRESIFADPALRSIVERCWHAMPHHTRHTALDAWVVMPNHLHGIVIVDASQAKPSGSGNAVPREHLQAGSLGSIIGTFKSVSARRINRLRHTPAAPVWQRNYYEHIVRNGGELDRIRAYIAANPARWALDRENPGCAPTDDEWTAHEDLWFTAHRAEAAPT